MYHSTFSTIIPGRYPDFSPQKTAPGPKMDFSPQKMAALNARYVSVSMKCSEVEDIIARKKDERARLDSKIKALELGKLTLENDKRRIMCQIKDEKVKWSSSPVKKHTSVKQEDDLFGDDDVTDKILLGIKEVGEEISSEQGGKEIGLGENFEGDDEHVDDEILLGIKELGEEISSEQGGKEIAPGENVEGDEEPALKKAKVEDA